MRRGFLKIKLKNGNIIYINLYNVTAISVRDDKVTLHTNDGNGFIINKDDVGNTWQDLQPTLDYMTTPITL